MARENDHAVSFRVTETERVPPLGLTLGFGAMLPLLAGAALACALHGPPGRLAGTLTVVWGGAILCFLAGVRRGLSFRTPGGPRLAQIVVMFWLFLLGLAALALAARPVAPALLLAGFASLIVLDPRAARRQEAPLYFVRLRPVQMLLPVIALAALLALRLTG